MPRLTHRPWNRLRIRESLGQCGALADAYAVIVAFALDPSAGDSRLAPVQTAGAPSPPRPPKIEPAKPSRLNVLAGPLVATGLGLLPLPAYAVGVRAAIEGDLRWEMAGRYWPDQEADAVTPGAQGLGARVRLASLSPSVCKPITPSSSFRRKAKYVSARLPTTLSLIA